MPTRDDIAWFKEHFHEPIAAAVAGTPFDLDMLTAIACQETGYIWRVLRRKALSIDEIVALCVGDTIGAPRRAAFPRSKADLLAVPDGQAMFDIARQALVAMAQHVPGYESAVAKPDRFCHGFGVFQYDLQFFKQDPDYFLQRRYERFEQTLRRCVDELRSKLERIGWGQKPSLTEHEMACVAIAYNTGGFKPHKGLLQGHFDGTRYYGQAVFDFLRLSKTVPTPGGAAPLPLPPDGHAIVPPPSLVAATGPFYRVDTLTTTLRLRREPKISVPPTANVVAELPDGHLVRAVTGTELKRFLEVETSLAGALLRGFASTRYLRPEPDAATIPVVVPATTPPLTGVTAVHMPRKAGTVTRRSQPAGAHSLNEEGQPGRTGATAEALRAELGAIIDWLAVDSAAHTRYRSTPSATFCNVYAHDYCHLAGAYLPRVWWTPKAIEGLTRGESVTPAYGSTIEEMRANDLFRWLRDFGDRFGWRQTGTLDKLQLNVDQGGIGLIVARRKQDGFSGHIVVVVPETVAAQARRNATGEVVAPLQSQAGRVNFRYGTGRARWWTAETFAESALWLHS